MCARRLIHSEEFGVGVSSVILEVVNRNGNDFDIGIPESQFPFLSLPFINWRAFLKWKHKSPPDLRRDATLVLTYVASEAVGEMSTMSSSKDLNVLKIWW